MEKGRLDKKMSRHWAWLIFIPVVIFLLSFSIGRYPISISELFHTVYYHFVDPSQIIDSNMETALFNIRFPRVIVALLVGGGLSVAGAAYQGMFKNPLVSPDILGASAGAGFGAALGLYLSLSLPYIQIMAFVGGVLAVLLATQMNRRMSADPILGLVLGGILVSTLFSSGISAVKLIADTDDKLPAITFWLIGSLASITVKNMVSLFLPMGIAFILFFALRWKLNVLSFGEEEARSMGINTKRVRGLVIIGATLITASAVAVCGMIGWIGLVIPHLARMIVGPNYKALLPVSFILGSSYLLAIDTIAKSVWSVEIPIGILTAILGVPFFLLIYRRSIRR